MIDQPGKLYIGREFDLATNTAQPTPFMLNARDLTTHALCLGMTGTGKTGLGIGMLEEMLLQNIPTIIIDPKGDITNLALAFPGLTPQEFAPWVDPDDAARQNLSVDTLAEQTAKKWKDGLAAWDITGERLATLRDRAAFLIYTPGSDTGMSVNVLQGLNMPDPSVGLTWEHDAEVLRERIAQVASAILGLAGVESDPMKGREHILLATIFEAAWRAGQPVDLIALIGMIADPPVKRVGVFDMDTFYPKNERFELAMSLNNLVASPSFGVWQTGQALDVGELLKPLRGAGGSNPAGKTRANIFYLAHLSDTERQFFITLLLSQLVMWMRAQTGTSILRCIVYFDEVFGFCPPFPRNPPTKTPIMTIIKQGRAAGLGMFLATQNPADLDYKGLSNIGTWLIGRLRTDRDRMRAMEGLEGAGVGFDRNKYENALSTLPSRVFLAQSTSITPRFFQTRWAMSFLRGPMTRDQVRSLKLSLPEMQVAAAQGTSAISKQSEPAVAAPVYAATPAATPAPQPAQPERNTRPPMPPGVREVFLPVSGGAQAALYHPHLLGSARLRIADRSSGNVSDTRKSYMVELHESGALPDFEDVQALADFDPTTLRSQPAPGIGFAPMAHGVNARWLKATEKSLTEHIYRDGATEIWHNRALKLYGRVGESQNDFRLRCEATARQLRDNEATKLRDTFDRRLKVLQDKLAAEQRELTSDRADLDARKREELLTNAESIFNFVLGKRRSSTGRSVSRGATKRRMTQDAEADVRESEETITKLSADLQQTSADYRAALDALTSKWMALINDAVQVPIAPKKSDIYVDVVAIAWVPR